MSYSSSPYAPRARRDAVNRVLRGETRVAVARSVGVHPSTIGKWMCKRTALHLDGRECIPTLPSIAHAHPNQLQPEVVAAIIHERERSGRCAELVWYELRDQGIAVSLSSVKRTLRRHGLTRTQSKWKRYRPPVPRPEPDTPGALVQMDTIHFMRPDMTRFYVFTLIDLYSRAVYAEYAPRCTQQASLEVVARAQDYLGIPFTMVQTDNGAEFAEAFRAQLSMQGIALRHTRLQRPNDNAHIERFNRTIQDECLSPFIDEQTVPGKVAWYLIYYNWHRRHLGIHGKLPGQMLPWR
jgi:transposase InsO family protein